MAFALVAFSAALVRARLRLFAGVGVSAEIAEDGEGRGSGGGTWRDPGGFENRFELAGADYGVDLGMFLRISSR